MHHIHARLPDLDLSEAVGIQMGTHRWDKGVVVAVDHKADVAQRMRFAGNGVYRGVRVAGLEGKDVEGVPAEDLFAERQRRVAPIGVDVRVTGAAADFDIRQRSFDRFGNGGGHEPCDFHPAVLIDHAGDGIGQNDAGVGQQPTPVAGMVRAFAKVHRQLEVEHPARAEKQGRARGCQTWAVGGDENIRRKLFGVCLAERAEAGRAVFFAHFQQQFDVETQRAVACLEGLFQGGQVDQVLALVVRGATAVPAITALNDFPRRQARLPLRVIAAHHITMAVAEQGRQRRVFDAGGDHQGPAPVHRVVVHLDAETKPLDVRGDELVQVTIKLRQARGLLALGGISDAVAEQGEKGAVVELLGGVFDGMRTATHEGISSRVFEVSRKWQRTVPPSMRPAIG
ncbi:hypothetical protein ALP75_200844 [Pseudomonas syringae pv. actinidiae]|nr:hypothetical protein ALP75_200844 [Pseudomonas syringae pv. actinidiae]